MSKQSVCPKKDLHMGKKQTCASPQCAVSPTMTHWRNVQLVSTSLGTLASQGCAGHTLPTRQPGSSGRPLQTPHWWGHLAGGPHNTLSLKGQPSWDTPLQSTCSMLGSVPVSARDGTDCRERNWKFLSRLGVGRRSAWRHVSDTVSPPEPPK